MLSWGGPFIKETVLGRGVLQPQGFSLGRVKIPGLKEQWGITGRKQEELSKENGFDLGGGKQQKNHREKIQGKIHGGGVPQDRTAKVKKGGGIEVKSQCPLRIRHPQDTGGGKKMFGGIDKYGEVNVGGKSIERYRRQGKFEREGAKPVTGGAAKKGLSREGGIIKEGCREKGKNHPQGKH